MREEKIAGSDKKHKGHGKHGNHHGPGKHGNHHGKHSCRSDHGRAEKDHHRDVSPHPIRSDGDASHGGKGIASVNVEQCTGCGKCIKACPENAISVQAA